MTVAVSPLEGEIVRTADEWADVIKADLNRAVEGIVSAGRNLIQAKADVGKHGEWLPMLKQIGISQQWASRLMSIATNPAISNNHSGGDLPKAVNTLYELSRLPAEDIEQGIANGDITPNMTIRDAKEFAKPDSPPPLEPTPRPDAAEEEEPVTATIERPYKGRSHYKFQLRLLESAVEMVRGVADGFDHRFSDGQFELTCTPQISRKAAKDLRKSVERINHYIKLLESHK